MKGHLSFLFICQATNSEKTNLFMIIKSNILPYFLFFLFLSEYVYSLHFVFQCQIVALTLLLRLLSIVLFS